MLSRPDPFYFDGLQNLLVTSPGVPHGREEAEEQQDLKICRTPGQLVVFSQIFRRTRMDQHVCSSHSIYYICCLAMSVYFMIHPQIEQQRLQQGIFCRSFLDLYLVHHKTSDLIPIRGIQQ